MRCAARATSSTGLKAAARDEPAQQASGEDDQRHRPTISQCELLEQSQLFVERTPMAT